LEVVREFIGSTAHKDLAKAFRRYKVRYT